MEQEDAYAKLSTALEALDMLDDDLQEARRKFGNPPDRFDPPRFEILIRIILGQQISRHVAHTLWHRMQERDWITAESLGGCAYEDLQSIGLSRRKSEYVIDLARQFNSGELDLEWLNQSDASDFHNTLIKIRGIGDWTISNYRLFCLADLDAWPGNDLALMEAVKRLKSLDTRPTHKQMDSLALSWKPYRGAAALMLWHIYACLVRDARPTG